jgi:hypothetical protein
MQGMYVAFLLFLLRHDMKAQSSAGSADYVPLPRRTLMWMDMVPCRTNQCGASLHPSGCFSHAAGKTAKAAKGTHVPGKENKRGCKRGSADLEADERPIKKARKGSHALQPPVGRPSKTEMPVTPLIEEVTQVCSPSFILLFYFSFSACHIVAV